MFDINQSRTSRIFSASSFPINNAGTLWDRGRLMDKFYKFLCVYYSAGHMTWYQKSTLKLYKTMSYDSKTVSGHVTGTITFGR